MNGISGANGKKGRVWRERCSTFAFLAALTAMAGWTGWLTLRNAPQLFASQKATPASTEPDYIIEQFSVTRLSPEGTLATQLIAPKLTHYAANDAAEIEQPRVVARSADGTVTEVTARTGQLLRGGAQVDLQGQVQVVRVPPGPAAEKLVLNTEALTVLPDSELLKSAVAVQGTRGASVIRAQGMVLDNKQRTAVFDGKVTSTIAPKGQAAQ